MMQKLVFALSKSCAALGCKMKCILSKSIMGLKCWRQEVAVFFRQLQISNRGHHWQLKFQFNQFCLINFPNMVNFQPQILYYWAKIFRQAKVEQLQLHATNYKLFVMLQHVFIM